MQHLCKPRRAYIPNATFYIPKSSTFWFQRRTYLKFFSLYRHGGNLGHVTIYICYKVIPLNLKSRHMKFEFNWPSGF